MQGIPNYDKRVSEIENATEEAEVRNAVVAMNKDGSLTTGQKVALGLKASAKIGELNHQTTITASNGGGEGARDAGLAPAARNPGPLLMSPDELGARIDAYNALAHELEKRPGYIVQIKGKPFRTKGFWRTMARISHISVQLLEERATVDGPARKYRVVVRATAPDGSYADGIGGASSTEPAKKDMSDHAIAALAHTRAVNRAIADLVGFGEPSAEEVDADD